MKLRILALILTVVLFVGTFFTGQIVSADKMRGDINSDGVVDTKDLLLLRKKSANFITFTEKEKVRADCNNDNEVDIKDVNVMINYLLKTGELYTEIINGWQALYDWETYSTGATPSEFSLMSANAEVIPVSNNTKNTFSKKAVSFTSNGIYFESSKNGTNPTVSTLPTTVKIAQTDVADEFAEASNIRVLLNFVPKSDEIAIAYIGFTLNVNGKIGRYYHRIVLENYSEYNYFYFAGKEYTKMTSSRRTYLPDENVETITLSNADVKDISNICIWYESDKGASGAPLVIDDVDYYVGDSALDGSALDDAALPQPKEPQNDGTKKYMAISFDDGPQTYGATGRHYIDYYLDLAKKYNAKFTFFIQGNNCGADDVDTLKRALEQGHSLQNHSRSHPNLNNLTLEEATKQLTDVDDWLRANVDENIKTKYLRPPFLNTGTTVYQACQAAGIKACVAGPCSADYNRPSVDYSELYYKKKLGDGVISLNHENYIEGVETVRRILEYFSKLGYEFVTVDELFNIKGVTPTLDRVYDKVG